MNKSTPILKTICAATILAMGLSAQANLSERYIVTYDSNSQGLKKGHQIKVEGKNWFAVELDEKGKSAMKAKAGFKNIEVDAKRFPMAIYNDDAGDPTTQQLTPYAIKQSQANQLTLQSGQKVCVIDSGLDMSNNDFTWSNITGDNDSGTGNWFEHGGPHGTHVAGTVGAADNGFGVVGMAPGVPMHIIKVFNEAGWGYSSDLAHAANLCDAAGANIITMSLGGGGANSTEENAFNSFTDAGGLVLAAAGNDGNSVRSYPAGYKSVMMIGANDGDNNIADFSQFPSNSKTSGRGKRATTETHDGFGVEVTAGGVNTLSTYPAGLASMSSLIVDDVGVASAATDNTGAASGTTYFMNTAEATDSGANGKVCVIDRGVISFADKINNCGNSGGIGAIVINNVAGDGVIYMDITGVTTNIPAVGTAFEDRDALVNSTSASIDSGASDYGYMSGTSMATPAVAGVAALVWSNNPNCTNTEIREALKATADDQGTAGRDDYFGYGIVKAADASASLANCGGTPPTGNSAPLASFTYSCDLLNCDFTSTSSDSDGSIASTTWDFGDGNSAAGSTASNTYAATGSYTTTVTVTDNEGASSTSSQTVSVSDGSEPPVGNLAASGSRSKGGSVLNITWSGFNSTSTVDIGINTQSFPNIANDGAESFSGASKRTAYTISVCETGTTNCAPPFIL